MADRAGAPPERLLALRREVHQAERRGVEVPEAKRLLLKALLAHRGRRLDEMGEAIREAGARLKDEDAAWREERLRRELWALRDAGADAGRLAAVETALVQHDLVRAEAALAAVRGGKASRPRRHPFASNGVALLFHESQHFVLVHAEVIDARPRVIQIVRGTASQGLLDTAIVKAIRSLRPAPGVVHAALPRSAHILSQVAMPNMAPAERDEALRWKLAKLCDFDAEGARLAGRPMGQGVLGLMAPANAVEAVRTLVGAAGRPVGRLLAPGEALAALLPPPRPGVSTGLLDISRDGAWFYVFTEAGPAFSRDLGGGTALWHQALETPISSRAGTVRISAIQSREVLERFDISGTENLVLADGTALNDKDIHSLIRPFVERMQDALSRSVEFATGTGGCPPVATIFLCGEGAQLSGLDKVLSGAVGLPVERLELGSKVEVPAGTDIEPGDAVPVAMLASLDRPLLDLAPPAAAWMHRLSRAQPASLAAGIVLALGLAAMGFLTRFQRVEAARNVAIQVQEASRMEERCRATEALAARPPEPPRQPSSAALLLREVAGALPPGGALQGLRLSRGHGSSAFDLEVRLDGGEAAALAFAARPRFVSCRPGAEPGALAGPVTVEGAP